VATTVGSAEKGKIVRAFAADLGYDYLWLSNDMSFAQMAERVATAMKPFIPGRH